MASKIVDCLFSYFVAIAGQTVSEGAPSKDRQLLLLTEARKLLTTEIQRFLFIFLIEYFIYPYNNC